MLDCDAQFRYIPAPIVPIYVCSIIDMYVVSGVNEVPAIGYPMLPKPMNALQMYFATNYLRRLVWATHWAS